MSFLELHTGDNNNPLMTVRGEDVHLYSVILNPKGFAKRMYDMASTVSQIRRFFPCENSKNIFLLKSTQNHVKRIVNHFFLKKKKFKKNLITGLGHRKNFKILEKNRIFFIVQNEFVSSKMHNIPSFNTFPKNKFYKNIYFI